MQQEENEYADIINLPYKGRQDEERMSMYQRAAQFAPFAALTGHGAAINETARQTDRQIELSENEQRILDAKLALLLSHLHERPVISVTHFVPDALKSGGRYTTYKGVAKKWNDHEQQLVFEDNTIILLRHIIDIDGTVVRQNITPN